MIKFKCSKYWTKLLKFVFQLKWYQSLMHIVGDIRILFNLRVYLEYYLI